MLFTIFGLCAIPAFTQFNPYTNSFTTMAGDEPGMAARRDNLISYTSASGVPCTANSFWALIPAGIDLFTLNGTVITKVGTTIISGSFDPSLAYCNNLNGGGFTPTFYSTQNNNQVVFYNGSGVTTTSAISSNKILNCGGNGNYLYYIMYDASYIAKGIVRYDGTSILNIYSFPGSKEATVADLAVDVYGNVWFFTGADDGLFNTDTLNVVSPGGQLLKQFPFAYNTLNGYGCFLLNSILYVGLGSTNATHPNTLLPITITSGSAIAGTPIAMPVTTSYYDLASCTPGSPLSVNEHNALEGIIVYPNPVTDKFTINSNTNEPLEILLYDITARELMHQYFTYSVTINTEQLTKGIYLYKILNKNGGEKTGKFVKE